LNFLERDEYKELIKEALKEWLDEHFSKFGKWTLRAALALIFSGLIFIALKFGWRPI